MIFHSPRRKLPDFKNVKVGKQYIQRCKYVKSLGVLMDEHLTWKFHITGLCKELYKTVGIFLKVRHYALLPTLVSLYNSLFLSFLSYGILVWGLTFESYLNPLLNLQKKALRSIKFQPFSSPSTQIFQVPKNIMAY